MANYMITRARVLDYSEWKTGRATWFVRVVAGGADG